MRLPAALRDTLDAALSANGLGTCDAQGRATATFWIPSGFLAPLAFPDAYLTHIVASAALWCAAFAIFTVVYFPILTRPRLDGQPG